MTLKQDSLVLTSRRQSQRSVRVERRKRPWTDDFVWYEFKTGLSCIISSLSAAATYVRWIRFELPAFPTHENRIWPEVSYDITLIRTEFPVIIYLKLMVKNAIAVKTHCSHTTVCRIQIKILSPLQVTWIMVNKIIMCLNRYEIFKIVTRIQLLETLKFEGVNIQLFMK